MPAHIKYPIINGLKECGDCHEWKPVTEYRPNRKRLTSRCVLCLQAYAAAYRQRPEVKAATQAYVRDYHSKNRQAHNENLRRYRQKPEAKLIRNATRRAWTAREKDKAIAYKGGACIVCGYSACSAALDFHHLNPEEKEGYGTAALMSHRSFENNKAELDKCVLVCCRCHREIHAGVEGTEQWLVS